MAKFVLTAELSLQAPKNVAQVFQQIQSQLNNVQVNVKVQSARQAQRDLNNLARSADTANDSFYRMGRTFTASIKRFSALAIATRAVSLFTNTLSGAIEEAISFQQEVVRLSQVTGESINKLSSLTNEITNLSTSLGVSSDKLLSVATILAQAGLSAEDTRIALNALAKTELAPTFGDIKETAEGAVAILAQFKLGAGALEEQLGSLNAVAGKFAVESSDLIEVVRRTGGVFKASGGDLNELIALFTSVRATTRESAATISTGLRTIFTRIQRPKTIEYLKQFGVELTDIEGKFVGPYEAIKRLSQALAGLEEGDITFIQIAEELGGFRQIGKVIPLLREFATAQEALKVAQQGAGSLAQDQVTAQQALAIQITKVKEEFFALVRGFTETATFRLMADVILKMASTFIQLADAIKPILPLITAFAAVRFAQGIGGFLGGMMGGRKMASGGKVHYFARGGLVPGSGNRDTVPAMLSPGEFVIRKSSVNKLGASNLAAMNENRFALGGEVKVGAAIPDYFNNGQPINGNASVETVPSVAKGKQFDIKKTVVGAKSGFGVLTNSSMYDLYALENNPSVTANTPPNKIPKSELFDIVKSIIGGTSKNYQTVTAGVNESQAKEFNKILNQELKSSIKRGAILWSESVGVKISESDLSFSESFNLPAGFAGTYFESVVDAFAGRPIGEEAAESKRPFDFISGLKGKANEKLFQSLSGINYVDAKISKSSIDQSEYEKKIKNQLAIDYFDEISSAVVSRYNQSVSKLQNTQQQKVVQRRHLGGLIQKYAKGGITQPLVDDILSNSSNAILPTPQSAIQKLIQAGGGFVDIDRTLKRTIGDQAYARAGTEKEKQAVLNKYFVNTKNRLDDIKTSGLTQFGKELQNSIKSGQLNGSSVRIISKSPNTPGVAEYLSGVFGIPSRNFVFTSGRSKVPLMRQFASGGGVGTDTVPALLTPGEFVINKKSAQAIGYGSLNRMNKVGRYANGGIVQRFNNGTSGRGVPPITSSSSSLGEFIDLTSLTSQAKALADAQKQQAEASGKSRTASLLLAGALSTASSSISYFKTEITENSSILSIFSNKLLSTIESVLLVISALQAFGISLTRASIQKGLESLSSKFPKFDNMLQRTGVSTSALAAGMQAAAIATAATTAALNTLAQTIIESYKLEKERQIKLARASEVGSKQQLDAIDAAGKAAASESGMSVRNTFGTVGATIGGFIGGTVGTVVGGTAGAAAGGVGAVPGAVAGGTAGGVGGAVTGYGIGMGVADLLGYTEQAELVAQAETRLATTKAILDDNMAKASKEATKALKDFEDGVGSASDVLKSTRAAGEALNLRIAEVNRINDAQRNQAAQRSNIPAWLTFGYIDNREERMGKAEEESKIRNKELQQSIDDYISMNEAGTMALARASAAGEQTFEEFFQNLQASNEPLANAYLMSEQNLEELRRQFQNITKEAEKVRKAFEAINLGFQGVNATASSMITGLENYLASQKAGNISLTQSLNTLKAGLSNAAQGISSENFQKALIDAEVALRSMGADGENIAKFKENMTAINTAQKFYATATDEAKRNLQAEFKRGAAGVTNPEKQKEALSNAIISQLEGAGIGPEVRERIKNALDGAEIDPKDLQAILGGNFDVLDKVLQDLGEKTFSQVEKALEQYIKYQQELVRLTEERIQIEGRLRDAQKNTIDATLEAARIAQEFGGASVTPQQSRQAIIDKANIDAQNLGVGNLKTGSAKEIKARQENIRQRLEEQKNIVKAAAAKDEGAIKSLQGQGGVERNAETDRLQKLAQENYNTTKALIEIKKEEIRLIQAKNQLEKSSMDALASGDIMKFFDTQAAIGAQAALATGNQQLISQFDPASIGTAIQDLEKQREAGVDQKFGVDIRGRGGLIERGYSAVGGRFGIGQETIQAAAQTTPEQLQAEKEARDLAATLPENMSILEMAAEKDLEAANIQLEAATKQLEAAKTEVAQSGQGPQPVNKASGGLIYARRGTFVDFRPKGTDTIPAMLTPGEFVVNRQAVQRGNNLAILTAMNKGKSTSVSANMSKGGKVQYLQRGSTGPITNAIGDSGVSISIDYQSLKQFSESLNKFNTELSKNIQNLRETKFSISLAPTNINVNLTGTSFLEQLTNSLKQELISYVGKEISQYTVGSDGKLKKSGSTLGTGL